MPEIKIKHVVSFSSEDKVHKAENLIKPETYRKWKCATPGEKSATILLQFEKATQIHSIDIGNESSAFVEILVGRSSDSVKDYQVLLVASSFMSPLESRNGTHANRVRMFGPEKLSQNTKNEKWDYVQIVCTQPFNKTITYGLTFIKFNSVPEKNDEQPKNSEAEKSTTKLGAFSLKSDDEDSLPSIGSWFGKQKSKVSESPSGPRQTAPSYAAAVLASNSDASKLPLQSSGQKRKNERNGDTSQEPPAKKAVLPTVLNKEHIVYKDVLQDTVINKKVSDASKDSKKVSSSQKEMEKKKTTVSTSVTKQGANNEQEKVKKKMPINKIMDRVVFVLSGFVNPLRSELRDKAIEMGAKYKPDWDASCTHLICAFINTPKYGQVKKLNGRIVSKDWILDCYRKKEPLLYRKYVLSSKSSGESEDSEEELDDSDEDSDYSGEVSEDSEGEYRDKKKRKKTPQTIHQRKKKANSPKKKNMRSPIMTKSPSTTINKASLDAPNSKKSKIADKKDQKNVSSIFSKIKQLNRNDTSNDTSSSTQLSVKEGSETDDEDALQDYIADTDVEEDSGGDTEDEILKAEMKVKKNDPKRNGLKKDKEIFEKPDVTDLPLPELPNFFKRKHFFLFGDFSPSMLHDLHRYITAYNGIIGDYMSDQIKYVITEKKWDSNFEKALDVNEELIFVKPTWIYKCHQSGKLVPYQPHIVIPYS